MVTLQRPRRFPQSWIPAAALAAFVLLTNVSQAEQAKYLNAQEAFQVGAAFVNARNFAASQEPLEMALQLAQDDAMKLKVSEMLVRTYSKLAIVPKMIERSEFIIEKSDQEAQKINVRRALLSFLHEHGKADEWLTKHEQILAKEPNQRTSLFLLSEAYDQLKRDPKRAAELTQRLLELEKKEGKPRDVNRTAGLAAQLAKAKKHKEAAELYEQIAPLDEKLAAWHWKEAASAWLQLNEPKRALDAARKSAAAQPESRNDLLAYFWRRGLADVFLKAGDATAAVVQYEEALKKATIDGYRKECEKLLAEAKAKSST